MLNNFIQKEIQNSISTKERILTDKHLMKTIEVVSQKIVQAYKNGNKTLIAGNGGSAGDAQHIAGELVGRFNFDRSALPSIALTTDSTILTAIGNDYGFDKIFSRQIEANGKSGDIFIGISTSGNSKNILEALKVAKNIGIVTISLTGATGGKMKELADYSICIPSEETPRIQESHILIGHIICAVVENEMFGEKTKG